MHITVGKFSTFLCSPSTSSAFFFLFVFFFTYFRLSFSRPEAHRSQKRVTFF